MRQPRFTRLATVVAIGALIAALAPAGAAAATASCTGQFASVASKVARPLGLNIVVPEIRLLTLGGPNLGQEVKALFATADRTSCPVPPPAP